MDKAAIGRLFIAVPELTFNSNFIDHLLRLGLIDEEGFKRINAQRRALRKANRALGALSSGSLIARLTAVAPEIINEDLINLLAGTGAYEDRVVIRQGQDDTPGRERRRYRKYVPTITTAQASGLRLALRSLKVASRGGLPSDRSQVFSRLARVIGVNLSNERINMWLAMGLIDKEEAARWKGYLSTGNYVKDSVVKVARAKSLLDAFLLLGQISVDDKFIAQIVASGVLDERLGKVYQRAVALGIKEWKVFSGLRRAEGLQKRLLLVLTGSLNRQLLDLLYETKIITGKQWSALQIVEVLARNVNDRMLEDLVKRRYRVRPGEAPIRTFARARRGNDSEVLRLLARAAQESRKEAEALAALDAVGATTRSRQYRLASAGLHEVMRNMWDGVGYLTIYGEREVAEAAVEAAQAMQRSLLTGKFAQLGDALTWQAKSGVDSYISREENTLKLSRLVYKNVDLYAGRVDKRIKLSLLQGKSPREIAKDVEKYINPDVPGGVSYAAMRLSRTEVANAFHYSTIRFTRENPWVRGYQWHLSNSHGRPDICNDYADRDHDGLGRGCFKKANVPGKPHPHCLCYLTTVQMTPAEFAAASKAGRFDSFYKQIDRASAYENLDSSDRGQYARRNFGNFVTALGKP